MTLRNGTVAEASERDGVSRRRVLTAIPTGIAVSAAAGNSLAETLADVPAREPGDVLSGHSERSKYESEVSSELPGTRPADPNRESGRSA
jgi:sulfane dehydrogenase subunit SoxC